MRETTPNGPLEQFCAKCDAGSAPRTLFIVAHPDDETIGAGGQLGRVRDGALIVVTDGAPRQGRELAGFPSRAAYADCRRAELRDALRAAGASIAVHELGITDQDATHELIALSGVLAAAMQSMRPALVITHPYEGGHPDHDATAFATHAAAALVERATGQAPPIAEMTSYHVANGQIEIGCFLGGASADRTYTLALDDDAARRKRDMFACYASQRQTLQWFRVDRECFRLAPRYDFIRPPHDGMLFYEYYDWSMSGPAWRARASEALHALSLERAP